MNNRTLTASRAGRLFAIEGPDGCGKTTIASAVCRQLCDMEYTFQTTSFPGRDTGSLGALVYRLHHNCADLGVSLMTPASLQALHVAAHLDAIENKLTPMTIKDGISIVLDRYWWSTWVYGVAAGVSPRVLDYLIGAELALWDKLSPTCVFLIQRDSPIDRTMSPDTFRQLTNLYRTLSDRETDRVKVQCVDNNANVSNAIDSVVATIVNMMANK